MKKIINCNLCNNVIKRQRFYRKGLHNFCNSKCHGLYRSQEQPKYNIKLFKDGQITDRGILKRTMISFGIEHKCSICNIKDWLGKPISMVLDHIDGKANNNLPSNLRFLCHNCDSQSDHYKGRNRGNGRKALGLI